MTEANSYNGRRINSNAFFEPIYDPELAKNLSPEDFGVGSWDFSQQKGPCKFVFKGDDLKKDYEKIDGIIFLECDILGVQGKAITFKKCIFTKCDFRGEFRNVKFSNCTFDTSSLSLVKFHNCQFRDCTFVNIGASGNETQFVLSDITNPGDFLKAVSTNLLHLPSGKTKEYQLLRLEQTKATLARVVLSNQSTEGSDLSYYDAVKASTLYGTRSRGVAAKLKLPRFDDQEAREKRKKPVELLACAASLCTQVSTSCEYWILQTAGLANAWGRSIFRVISIGIFLVFLAGWLRSYFLCHTFMDSIVDASEVFLLFGYTKHSMPQDVLRKDLLNLGTAFLGLCWFAVAAATIVNRVTKVRG
ncbi:anti-phage Hailong system effector protein HalA [Roseobacter sp. A03A-229]